MKYFLERSLFYYFLMLEVTESGAVCWRFVCSCFGVDARTAEEYAALLGNELLDELSTVGDIDLYLNYIGGYFKAETQFGKDENERTVLEIKSLALHRAHELFDGVKNKVNRLRLLAQYYERDRVAAVLYAMQLLASNGDKGCQTFARDILERELNQNDNSDAGLVLLNTREGNYGGIVDRLRSLPDILIRPQTSRCLADRYGGGNIVVKNRHPIGF